MTVNLLLQRKPSSNACTHGDISIEGTPECFSLEDEVRSVKIPGQTAIAPGRYRVVINQSDRAKRGVLWSPNPPFLAQLLNVPDYTGTRFHALNTVAETEGCIGVGQVRSVTTILHSRAALSILQAKIEQMLMNGDEVWITIKNAE